LARAGHGQIVAAVAEPGVGESRLFFEFKTKNQSGWMVVEGVSPTHGEASPYLPVLGLLHAYFGIESGDHTRRRREKVVGKVLGYDRAFSDMLPYLLGLLGLAEGDDPLARTDPEIRRRRTHEALKRILLRESLNQPLMVVFEDLHWIDEETQAFLNLLADSIGTAKLLLLVTYRPEYSHAWNSKTYYTQLRLDPLGGESAAEMLDALLGDGAQATAHPLAALKRLIIEKTEGTPLFREEMVQALQEDGALVRNGTVKVTRPVDALRIPSTVQDIIAARIDRLPASDKEVLQTLAVIGMEFPLALVQAVIAKPDDELSRILRDLQLAEFIYEQPAVSDVAYIFKHPLTQEVSYNSVLLERRKVLHERIGAAIEMLYPQSIDDHVSELARHYLRGNNFDKAIHFLELAADQAAGRSAMTEADSYLHDAIRLLGKLPPSPTHDTIELGLQTTLGTLLSWKGFGAPEREEPLKRAYELSQRVTDFNAVLPALFQLVQFYIARMRLDDARELAAKALEKASQTHDPILNATAHYNVGEALFWSGELQKSYVHFNRSRELFDQVAADAVVRAHAFDWWLLSVSFLAAIDLIFGKPASSISWGNRVVPRALASPQPYSKAFGIVTGALSFTIRGAWQQVAEMLSRVYSICEFGFNEGKAVAKLFGGRATSGAEKKSGGWHRLQRLSES